LALDPDLDTYYLQNIVMGRLPLLLGQLGEAQTLLEPSVEGEDHSDGREVRFLVLDGLIRSTLEGIEADVTAAYRGNPQGSLKRAVDGSIGGLVASASSYLSDAKAGAAGATPAPVDARTLDRAYAHAVDDAISA